MDISAMSVYSKNIAPESGSCIPNLGDNAGPEFLIKGQEPAGVNFSYRDLSRRTGYPYVNFCTG